MIPFDAIENDSGHAAMKAIQRPLKKFIDINGTIVGGLAGLVIYALSLVLPRF